MDSGHIFVSIVGGEHIFSLKSEVVPPPEENFSCCLLYFLKIKATTLTLLNELFSQSLEVYMPKQCYNDLPTREISKCKLTWLNLVNREVNCGYIIFFLRCAVLFGYEVCRMLCFARSILVKKFATNCQRDYNKSDGGIFCNRDGSI